MTTTTEPLKIVLQNNSVQASFIIKLLYTQTNDNSEPKKLISVCTRIQIHVLNRIWNLFKIGMKIKYRNPITSTIGNELNLNLCNFVFMHVIMCEQPLRKCVNEIIAMTKEPQQTIPSRLTIRAVNLVCGRNVYLQGNNYIECAYLSLQYFREEDFNYRSYVFITFLLLLWDVRN